MSAVVCGKRSSFFEDHSVPSSSTSSSPPSSKRVRCFSSSSLIQFSSSARFFALDALDRLVVLFPDMDKQVLDRTLNQCGEDIETAIESLIELRLGSIENAGSAVGTESDYQSQPHDFAAHGVYNGLANGEVVPLENSPPQKQPAYGAEWVDLFVKEMLGASNMDDAGTRASRAPEMLEKSLYECGH